MNPRKWFIFALVFAATSATAKAEKLFVYSSKGSCGSSYGHQFVEKGRDGRDVKPALNLIATLAGQKITLISCYRDEAHQTRIRKDYKCAPEWGKRDCRGLVAKRSEHTYGLAADIVGFAGMKRQCQILAKARSLSGGRGGVGGYSSGSGHFDMGKTRVWNRCSPKHVGNLGGAVADDGYKSPSVASYKAKKQKSGRKCYPTKKYPNCCGPKRAAKGLCTL